MLIKESYSLKELGFYINFPFPDAERREIENALKDLDFDSQKELQQKLDGELSKKLAHLGYISDKESCALWKPDFKNSVDIYHADKKIAI